MSEIERKVVLLNDIRSVLNKITNIMKITQFMERVMGLRTLMSLVAGIGVMSTYAEKSPNIIVVMTDDQGYPVVGAHGHPWIETPNLDAMYERSARFDRFMMGSTCAPSRAGFITGSHSIRHGVTHTIFERERLNLESITIPEVLSPAGYQSGYFGKWHLGDEPAYMPDQRGFDHYFIHGAGGIGQVYKGSCADVPKNKYFDPVFKENGTYVKTEGYCTDVLFQATLGWVNEKKDDEAPFFAFLSLNAPHGPFIAPPAYQEKFEKLGFKKQPAGFYGMIEHLDHYMGVLFEKLDEWGLTENTVVVFTSDNGMTRVGCGLQGFAGRPQVELGKSESGEVMMSYNAGMKGLKGTVHEGGVRAPLFIQWKGVTDQGRTVKKVASYLDVLPTFAEIAGAELPAEHLFEGRSLVSLIEGNEEGWTDRFLFQHVTRWPYEANPDQYKWQKYSVRSQRFRLVEGVLYDMENDPEQNVDVTRKHLA